MATLTFLCFLCFSLLTQSTSVRSYNVKTHNPISKLFRQQLLRENPSESLPFDTSLGSLPVHIVPQDGLKRSDKIDRLPGQPEGVEFDQYSGYVTVDPDAGRALFYYFTQSPHNSTTKPLVLWLNGGPGCSSLGDGAFMELGPFRVHKDGKTLYENQYSWNHEANIIFLESPAGVGFSYSNRTSDYNLSGDKRTAHDSYTFIVNWLERFPEYKSRDFFITGESYAGHYVPQLAQTILHHNKYANRTIINLKGIAIGNALVDNESHLKGSVDFFWSHALISDEIYTGLISSCNFSYPNAANQICLAYFAQLDNVTYDIYPYDIYAPLCNSSYASNSIPVFDPCSEYYVQSYLNIPKVQTALHANVTSLHYPWEQCSDMIGGHWKDQPSTVLPVIQELMESGMRVWIYSGDTDGGVPVTCTRYSINKLGVSVRTAWYPWYVQEEVGGYAVEYQNMTFVTIRGSGHFVPSYQPARSLVFFSSFIHGNLPPSK